MESSTSPSSSSCVGRRCQVREKPVTSCSTLPRVTTILTSCVSPRSVVRWKRKNTSAPNARKCIRGSRKSFCIKTILPLLRLGRRVPDRRRVGTFRCGHRHLLGHAHTEFFGVVRGPARRRNFDDAPVVERPLRRIKIRVLPDGDQFRSTDRVGPRRILDVNGGPYRWQLAIGTQLAVAGPDHVINLLLDLTLCVEPTLDDLVAVEIGADRILQRGDKEGRRLAGSGGGKV